MKSTQSYSNKWRRSLKPLLCVIILSLAEAARGMLPRSTAADCQRSNPSHTHVDGRGCLARLHTNLRQYEVCTGDSNTTCYLFLHQPPFVMFNQPQFFNDSAHAQQLQRPFRCGSYTQQFVEQGGIGGISMRLHALTSSSDDFCMWVGHSSDCKFSDLVQFVSTMGDSGYRFAISNGLIDIPARRCRCEPGAPLLRDSVVIYGSTSRSEKAFAPIVQVLLPFHMGSWLLLGLMLLLLLLLRYAIAFKYGCFRGRRCSSCLLVLVDNLESLLSDQNVDASEARDARLALTLFRTGVVALVAIFALFYEVAVVNFLFQQSHASIRKHIGSLTQEELRQFAVPARTALEEVWKAHAKQGGKQLLFSVDSPWKQCASMEQCFEWLNNGKTKFVVSFGMRGQYLVSGRAACDELGLFETRGQLYQFSTVWLYNERCDAARRRTVDREVLSLRMDGILDSVIDEYSSQECKATSSGVIRPSTLLIPVMVLVLPAVAGVMAIVCRRRRGCKCEGGATKESDGESAEVAAWHYPNWGEKWRFVGQPLAQRDSAAATRGARFLAESRARN